MSTSGLMLWTALCAGGIAAAWFAYRAVAVRMGWQPPPFRLSAAIEPHWESIWPRGLQPGGISLAQAATIRQQAEQAARERLPGAGEPASPYPRDTAEYVLWLAGYQLAVKQLADEAAVTGIGFVDGEPDILLSPP